MIECETAQKLWNKAMDEGEKSIFTGYTDEFVNAYDEYINHIQDCEDCKL
jgi:hypothetical protein